MMPEQDPGKFFSAELVRRAPFLADLFSAPDRNRDSVARLLQLLPEHISLEEIGDNPASHEIWQLAGRFYMVIGRMHEALAVFDGLYQQMLSAQASCGKRLHKGMPLVWIADCYRALRFPVHAKRYLMLTLCEDALREQGTVNPDTTGIYFRLVWAAGVPHVDITRYAGEFFALANKYPDRAVFPEALLQELDDDWVTEYPSAEEAFHYRINQKYVQSMQGALHDDSGQVLERLAQYLMSCMPGCRAKRRVRSRSTDYDLVCSMEGLEVDFRSELGRYFVCECKDWSGPADFSSFAKFCRVLDSTKARFGVLFSRGGISGSGQAAHADREQLKVFQDRGIVIAVIDDSDLADVASGANLINLLRHRYEAVRLDSADD